MTDRVVGSDLQGRGAAPGTVAPAVAAKPAIERAGSPARARVLEVSALFREYAALVERVLRRAGVESRDVPDARQEVFLVAHRRLSDFEGRAQPSTWLCAIAIRIASDFRRKAHRRRERPEGAHGCGDVAGAAHAVLPEQRDELLRALDALEQVAAPQREVFVLFELFELPMNEVAARVGCPSKTAFSRLYAARRQLQAELRKRGLLAGAWPYAGSLRDAFGAHADAAHTLRGVSTGAASNAWPSWLVASAALVLLVKGPDVQVDGSAASRVRPSTERRASVIEWEPRVLPASATRAERETAPLSVAPAARAPSRRSHRREPYASRAAQPPPATQTAVELTADEFHVFRAGAHDPAPVGEHPWADLLLPEARVPARIRIRGPADPVLAVEHALNEI